MKEKLSVCIPVFNCGDTIIQTIKSIINQTYKDFEIIIVDNASTDDTGNIIKSINDPRIKLFVNDYNLGCGGNLNKCRERATGDILFFISGDDIADRSALEKVMDAFSINHDIGVVLRPYFWFEDEFCVPVRITTQFKKNNLVSINNSFEHITEVISLSDQISGISFRKNYMSNFYFKNIYFIEMASMVLSVIKIAKAYIIKDNIVAIRIAASGAKRKEVFENSPMLAWSKLINEIFYEKKFNNLKRYLVNNFIANNYIGLLQIKNYGSYKYLFREAYYIIKLKKQNLVMFRFWFYFLITLLIPSFLLKKIVIFYKNSINKRLIKYKNNKNFIEFTYENTTF